jgi:hypothetical protein
LKVTELFSKAILLAIFVYGDCCVLDFIQLSATGVAEIAVIRKCFKRLVKDHITSSIPDTLNPLQFTYCPDIHG